MDGINAQPVVSIAFCFYYLPNLRTPTRCTLII